jgi:hypothetical protein
MPSVRYYDWIAHFGRRTPDKIAAIDLASDRRLSYAEFDGRISRLATHLRDALGVERQALGDARLLLRHLTGNVPGGVETVHIQGVAARAGDQRAGQKAYLTAEGHALPA